MSIISSYYVYRILRLLTTSWKDLPAYKLGVIDDEGNRLLPDTELTREQSDTVGLLERLVFNLKRLLEKTPGGKTKIGAYAAALWLIRESVDMDPVSAGIMYDHIEANGHKPEDMMFESVTQRFPIRSNVRCYGWVDTDTFDLGVSVVEGIVTGRATRSDIDGNAVYYVESAGRNLAVSSRVMEDVSADASAPVEGRPTNNVSNIKGVDKKLKPGMVRRKMDVVQ